ncbi:phage holin family protein [Ulvibacter antarcticus]|uniref:Putative superfamily III holin-X n=1 Tax=Ulvibacter antarcticus TaxID=442714 RepID=A0A3L9YZE3_9FLAO|nr:phage holin family protein [Ulvibacter antarcticus]RMA66016.1 putative superfamily III holin-X [Ulvibacter antarcticus]
MAFDSLSDNIEKSGSKAQEYLKNSSEYYKLRSFKTISKTVISLVTFLTVGIFLLLVLFFFSVGAALWLGDIIDSRYAGYFIVGGFYILIILIILLFGKKSIEKLILTKFSDIFFDNDSDPEPDVLTSIMANKEEKKEEKNEEI